MTVAQEMVNKFYTEKLLNKEFIQRILDHVKGCMENGAKRLLTDMLTDYDLHINHFRDLGFCVYITQRGGVILSWEHLV